MHLERVKLKCTVVPDTTRKKNRYGFTLSKNQKSISIYLSDQDTYLKIQAELKKRCILTSFQETYDIEKLIGKGSFGKVEYSSI